MNLVSVLILALVEGVTEFLPVSSTGHLMLTSWLLHLPQTEFVKSFQIVIQLGAILAVVVLYFSKLIKNLTLWPKLIAAFLPTAAVGLVFYKFIKNFLLGSYFVDILSLFFGGILIILLEKYFTSHPRRLTQINLPQSASVGLIQSLAVIPGVSRAGATIFGAMGLGLTRRAATEFSFLLAIPTMVAATGLDLFKTRLMFGSQEYWLILIGFFAAFISALFTVRWLINFVSRHSFIGFGFYRIVLALIFLLFLI